MDLGSRRVVVGRQGKPLELAQVPSRSAAGSRLGKVVVGRGIHCSAEQHRDCLVVEQHHRVRQEQDWIELQRHHPNFPCQEDPLRLLRNPQNFGGGSGSRQVDLGNGCSLAGYFGCLDSCDSRLQEEKINKKNAV